MQKVVNNGEGFDLSYLRIRARFGLYKLNATLQDNLGNEIDTFTMISVVRRCFWGERTQSDEPA